MCPYRCVTRTLLVVLALAGPAAAATDNVVLVTLDGVRIEEFFAGMDAAVADGSVDEMEDIEVTRERYWRATPEERREALLPHFWKELAPRGIVLGNPAKGSRVTVRNSRWFSYPGYSEILTGRPQPEVQSNDLVRYDHETVLQYVRRKLDLAPTEVAQIGSWDGFVMAASSVDGAFFMNGAWELVPEALSTPEMDQIGRLRTRVMEVWEESSNDALTFELALAYLKTHRPRLLWIGLGQSDDWAHARRYDRVLDYLHLADELLAELWQTVQSLDGYRDRTTLVLTTDHGRGATPETWTDHDAGIEGSQNIWIAVIGPDTPDRGEVDTEGVTQSDIAATILKLMGLDPKDYDSSAGPPIPSALSNRGR